MKQTKHSHIKKEERLEIAILLDKSYSLRSIAKALERSPSTLSEEIRRNSVKGAYDPFKANHKAHVRRKHSKYQGKKINEDNFLKQYIETKLKKHWSPDAISGKMRKEGQPFYTSKTAIYEFLYSARGQRYCCYLYSRRYRSRKQKKKTKRALIPNRIGIERRPKKVELNTEYGHFEGDTIVSGRKTGSKAALSVIYERKAKYIDARKIDSLKPKMNNHAIASMEEGLTRIKSMTLDNGIENIRHELLGFLTFFCDPYSAWQKGGVEQANKLIRRFIPKGSDIGKYSEEYVKKVIDILNNMPRKSLGYMTPLEVMRENNQLKRFEEQEQCASLSLNIKKQTECSV
jgi:IS30 family transposase